jgi:hypothetical protein
MNSRKRGSGAREQEGNLFPSTENKNIHPKKNLRFPIL